MKTTVIALLLLTPALIGTALGVVYTQHLSRSLVVQLQEQKQRRDDLNIEWSRLLLERSTWATHARVERLAREQLGMHTPSFAEMEVVRR
ncbi:MAG: cell division protein FtsL [Gammaproteobacteria bacterium]|nr:cell division protein FtsL [Gammaproteobacteria bacterium]